MMEAGINAFKCATIAEADMLGSCNACDVLLAYPLIGPKIQRFLSLMKHYPLTRFSTLVDNLENAQRLSAIALEQDVVINVYIDLNIGMNRTGIKPGKEAVQLYEDVTMLKGLRIYGLHAYDGHIREKDMQKRTELSNTSYAPVEGMRDELERKGHQVQVIVGGTPTFPIHAKRMNVVCSPGTFIFWDKGYHDALPEQQFLPAALIITTVVSLPDETKLCLDLGYKSIASENELNNRVYFLNAPDLKMVSHSEEHLVVEAGEAHSWKTGDRLYALPIHICPTCALYESAWVVEDSQVTGKWEIIARNRSIRF